MFVVSSLQITDGELPGQDGFIVEFEVGDKKGAVKVVQPMKEKCPRCWKYQSENEDQLCKRCEDVVELHKAEATGAA